MLLAPATAWFGYYVSQEDHARCYRGLPNLQSQPPAQLGGALSQLAGVGGGPWPVQLCFAGLGRHFWPAALVRQQHWKVKYHNMSSLTGRLRHVLGLKLVCMKGLQPAELVGAADGSWGDRCCHLAAAAGRPPAAGAGRGGSSVPGAAAQGAGDASQRAVMLPLSPCVAVTLSVPSVCVPSANS